MIGASDLLLGGVLPLVVAAAIAALVGRVAGSARTGWLVGFWAGFAAGHIGLECRALSAIEAIKQAARPHDAQDWLPALTALATLIGAIALAARGRRWIELVLAAPVCALLPWKLLDGSKYLPSEELRQAGFAAEAWSPQQTWLYLGSLAASLWIAWTVAATADPSDSPRLRSALAVLAAIATAAILALSGAIIYGQLLGVVAAATAGCGLANGWARDRAGPEGSAGPLTVAVGSLLLLATFYSALPPWRALALGLLWLLAVGSLPGQVRARLGWRSMAVGRAVLCSTLLFALAALAAKEFTDRERQQQESANPYDQYL